MRLNPFEVGSVVNLEQPFASTLPALPDLQEAYANPTIHGLLSPDVENSQFGSKLLEDGGRIIRDVAGRSGVQTGIQTPLVPPFLGLLTARLQTEDWTKYVHSQVKNGVDTAFQIAGAAPIIGAIAKVALDLVAYIVERAMDTGADKLPPQRLAQYSKLQNDSAAQFVFDEIGLGSTAYPDWTPIFRPPSLGPWTRNKTTYSRSSGEYSFFPSGGGDGLGYVPGYMRGIQQINFSAGDAGILSANSTGGGFDIMVRGVQQIINDTRYSKADRFKQLWMAVNSAVYDTSRTTPSGVQAASAAWQMLQTRTASMFNLDMRGLIEEWESYVWGALTVLDDYENSKAQSNKIQQDELDRFFSFAVRQHFYDTRPTSIASWDFPKDRRIDVLIKHKLNSLKTRQIKAMDTLLIAYCSDKQRAFRNLTGGRSGLGDMLFERRKQLLRSRWVQRLNLDDIVDDDYRREVAAAHKRGTGFGFQTATAGTPESPDPADFAGGFYPINRIPEGDAWDLSPTDGLNWFTVGGVIALLGAAGYGIHRYRKRR